jgi:hypothetical protein
MRFSSPSGSSRPCRISSSAAMVASIAAASSWNVVMNVIVLTPAFSTTIPRSTSASETAKPLSA